ncbi:FAD synthase-like isoform X4 [Bacillus rossius redtenbacheri]|uniref:FAD synthase-like isoform X4 n=1 Tax=Bacillus rossius redtenbacheri TaxID=93214 RepID=UPI002FDE1538
MSDLTAGIIVIGDEVLKGQVMDTNSHVLCKRLRACGISVRKVIENCLDRYDSSELFLSFNGGKDCTVLLHLVSAVFQKKHAHSKSQALRTVYIQCSDPFPEVESFIAESAERYNLDVICMSSPIKVALEKLLLKNPNLKAVLMGTRRTDPYSETLNHFQGLH